MLSNLPELSQFRRGIMKPDAKSMDTKTPTINHYLFIHSRSICLLSIYYVLSTSLTKFSLAGSKLPSFVSREKKVHKGGEKGEMNTEYTLFVPLMELRRNNAFFLLPFSELLESLCSLVEPGQIQNLYFLCSQSFQNPKAFGLD